MTQVQDSRENGGFPQREHLLSKLHATMGEESYSALQALTFAIKSMNDRERRGDGEASVALGAMLMAGKALLPRGMYTLWVEEELGLRGRRARWIADQTAGSMWVTGGGCCFDLIRAKMSAGMDKRMAAFFGAA